MLRWLLRHPFVLFVVVVILSVAGFLAYNSVPHHMDEFDRQEADLYGAFSPKMPLQQARDAFQARQIPFAEYQAKAGEKVLNNAFGVTLTAREGDTVLSTMIRTRAGGFPCYFGHRVILLFDADKTLRERHIMRYQQCM